MPIGMSKTTAGLGGATPQVNLTGLESLPAYQRVALSYADNALVDIQQYYRYQNQR